MEIATDFLSRFEHPLPVLVLSSVACYVVVGAVYRLYFHPLAKFPGRKLAALTFWNEFYYDIFKRGLYSFEIEKMHEQYGPIVRVNPDELHINDPDYFDQFYSTQNKLDKVPRFTTQFGMPLSTQATVSHAHHKLRRSALAPFFSRRMVTQLEATIQATIDKLCVRLSEFRKTQEPINLSLAYRCFSTDLVTEYAMDRTYGFLDYPDFNPGWFNTMKNFMEMGHLLRHFPIFFTIIKSLPPRVAGLMNPKLLEATKFQQDIIDHVVEVMNAPDEVIEKRSHRTIFHELFQSDLPPQEKTIDRIGQDGHLVVGAGAETVGNTLAVITFHLLNKPDTLSKLKEELVMAMPNPEVTPSWQQLEQLPYLSAVISEGLRLSVGVMTRSPRLAPDPPIKYKDWELPPGMVVSLSPWLIHSTPSIFPNPEAFDPDRWLGDNANGLDRYLVPFMKGSRQCLGIHLAYAELYRCLATVMRRFEMELWDTTYERDVKIKHDFFAPMPSLESKGIRVLVK